MTKTLTVPEAAERLKLSKPRVYSLIRTGKIQAVKDEETRTWQIDAESVANRKPDRPGRKVRYPRRARNRKPTPE